ncbi:MAG: diguanylate cyclase (GGDEF)-like protein/PAS domain S-box-containing protein [Gammaproteobacteria bacterium]|jgi:diguanylate cyclase (GGDEF)-like protein/PAS domain S-box-containing protein
MRGTTLTDDISPECTDNPDILRLYALWQAKCTTEGLPCRETMGIEQLWCAGDLILVEETPPDDFEFLRYGANVSLASGFDMTGKRTSDFHSDVGRFFTHCYQRCLDEHKAFYATNRAVHAALVTGWERLLLPLVDADGAPRFVLEYNRPLALKHVLLEHVLDAANDIIIGIERVAADDNAELDCAVLTVNAAAEEFLGCRRVDARGHYLSELVPSWRSQAWGKALVDGLLNDARTQLEWRRCERGYDSWYRVAVNPFAEGVVITMSDITELKEKEREFERLSNTDALTGMSNRRHFLATGQTETERAVRYNTPLSVVSVDIDHFKQINDRLGHEAGDEALIAVAGLLSRGRRSADALGRLGGEEFSILLPHTNEAKACELAQRLCADIATHQFHVGGEIIEVTCSFGVAQLSSDEQTIAALLRRADAALYKAKEQGRNRIVGAGGLALLSER